MHVLFEIDNGEQTEEFYFDGTPAEIRAAFLRYARMQFVASVAVWNYENGTRLHYCDNLSNA